MRRLQDELKLSFADLRARVAGDTLGQQQAQLAAELQKFLLQINAALPGGKNEAEREKQRADAKGLYKTLGDQLVAAIALSLQRQGEDYQVRYLRATGQTKAADDRAFALSQERERADLVKSFGDFKDATELAVLAQYDQTAAAEKAAYALNKLSTSALNMVQGYKIQATIFGASNPGGRPIGSPYVPTPTPIGTGGDERVTLVLADGTLLGAAVLKRLKKTAQRQFGDSTRWPEVQNVS
jgi:hypothetical protein